MASLAESNRAFLSRRTFLVSTILATSVLGLSFASRGLWFWVSLIVICGMLSIYGQKSGWKWMGFVVFFIYLTAAIRCAFLDIPSGWPLLSLVAALASWDLYAFMIRFNRAGKIIKAVDMERRHLKRLITTTGLGLALGAIALNADMDIRFGWLFFWALALVIGLGKLIERINRHEDEA
jgi:hypothetical protein